MFEIQVFLDFISFGNVILGAFQQKPPEKIWSKIRDPPKYAKFAAFQGSSKCLIFGGVYFENGVG